MCSRYTETAALDALADRFGIEVVEADTRELLGRYNVAPSQVVPIIVADDGRRRLVPARWGLRPHWARHGKIAPFNTRAEIVRTSRTLRDALKYARCLVLADGFYEWQTIPGRRRRQPYYVRLAGGGLFAFAGLFTPPRADDDVPATCTIITTTANALVAAVHDRMPVILDTRDETRWLNPFRVKPADVLPCLRPMTAELMEMYAVSTLVSSLRNEGPRLVEAVTLDQPRAASWRPATERRDAESIRLDHT